MEAHPAIAELVAETLRVMHNGKVGVHTAAFKVCCDRGAYGLFEQVKKRTTQYIEEQDALRDMIVQELRTDRGTPSTTPLLTYSSATAAALAKLEEEALVFEPEPPIPSTILANGQYAFAGIA